jgi:hypothetical protein
MQPVLFSDRPHQSRPASPGRQIDGASRKHPIFMLFIPFMTFMADLGFMAFIAFRHISNPIG